MAPQVIAATAAQPLRQNSVAQYGIAIDNAGNLYFAETANNRVRKVASGTGIISTIAGNGTAGYAGDGGPATNAELQSPAGVVLDSAGDLYIADQGNNVVRKVSASGTITTVAGNNEIGYSGDGGSAINATLHAPAGVAIDSAGNLYIADEANNPYTPGEPKRHDYDHRRQRYGGLQRG